RNRYHCRKLSLTCTLCIRQYSQQQLVIIERRRSTVVGRRSTNDEQRTVASGVPAITLNLLVCMDI
ncbi:unnamed protein product, partial [Ceratitis capitata]